MFWRFDVDRWIAHQLPDVLRKPLLYAFIRVLLYPVRQVQQMFLSFSESAERQLAYNAFTNYLERWLNGLFYFENDEIYITDEIDSKFALAFTEEAYDDVYVSRVDENPAVAALLESTVPDDVIGSFVVHVPSVLSEAQIEEVSRWVEFYKYAGTQFTIETYE